MNFAFHPSARVELEQAVAYYEDKRAGLGLEFADEVYAAIRRILLHPEAWGLLSAHTRRCLTHRFPYGIVYQIVEGKIYIIAVMHLHRKPDYYRRRIGGG